MPCLYVYGPLGPAWVRSLGTSGVGALRSARSTSSRSGGKRRHAAARATGAGRRDAQLRPEPVPPRGGGGKAFGGQNGDYELIVSNSGVTGLIFIIYFFTLYIIFVILLF